MLFQGELKPREPRVTPLPPMIRPLIGVVPQVNETNIIDRVAAEGCGKAQVPHQRIANISLGKTRDVHTGIGIDSVEFILKEVGKRLPEAGVYISTDSIFVIA